MYALVFIGKHIRITGPCDLYPFATHFYIVKLEFTGVYIFLFLLINIDCISSLKSPQGGGSNVYPQSLFRAEIRKIDFFIEKCQFSSH